MKNYKLIELQQGLNSCLNLEGITFAYAVVKNLQIIKSDLDILSKLVNELQIKHSKKDENNKPIIIDNKYNIIDMEKFNKEHEELMNVDLDIKLYKIKESDLPKNITGKQLMFIIDIIK